MEARLLHIFRNTPEGMETLLQSIHFCKVMDAAPLVYIPRFIKFLMYFENDVVQIDLDDSYLASPETTADRVEAMMAEHGLEVAFLVPKNFTSATLPDIPSDVDFMTCPRSISDFSAKIGLGFVGPRVRRLVRSARFPVLVTGPVCRPWTSIAVFFGGSVNAFKALRLGIRIHRKTGMPLRLFTWTEGREPEYYRQAVTDRRFDRELSACGAEWHFREEGRDGEDFEDLPHDALIVLGLSGHSLIHDMLFGSFMERVQAKLENPLLIVGPGYAAG